MLVPDYETKLMLGVLPSVTGNPGEIAKLHRWVRDRAALVSAGIRRCPTWFQEDLNRLDSKLRCWWDVSLKPDDTPPSYPDNLSRKPGKPWNRWVIDRLQDAAAAEMLERASRYADADDKGSLLASAAALAETGAYYLTVFWFEPSEEWQPDLRLIEYLRANDMTRYSPAEYRAMKEEASRKVREANEKAGDNKVLAAVDSMSRTQLKQFIEVSDAINTGETIIPYGEDAKALDRMREGTRKALAAGVHVPTAEEDAAMCINPGHRPGLH